MFTVADGKLVLNTGNIPKVALYVIIIAIAVFIAWGLIAINHLVFKKIQKKRTGLKLKFFERIASVIIFLAVVLIALSSFGGLDTVWQTVMGGTAIISAVVAFAAQDVLKDILGGLMISINKPFEVGDRIELEDGSSGVVTDMNARHVVLVGVDTLRLVIPNSRLNQMYLRNYSFKRELGSILFKFPVGYDSDMALVKKVIAKTIEDSEYTVPGKPGKDGSQIYGPVYFLELADSALIMAVTVYYEKTNPTEFMRNEINTKVREALLANGVEIPYPYVTVVKKD